MTTFTDELACPQAAVSHIIGPHGDTIMRLQQESRTRIEIVKGETNTPAVSISGSSIEDVKLARQLIEVIIENQAHPDYEGEEGRSLRAKADGLAKERSSLIEAANAAFAAQDKNRGHELMTDSKRVGEAMKAANDDAARAILAFNNDKRPQNVMDLHGLRAEEAVDAVRLRLNTLAAGKCNHSFRTLDIIVGAGHHTEAGKSVALMPAVEKHLTERSIKFTHRGNGTIVAAIFAEDEQEDGAARSTNESPVLTQPVETAPPAASGEAAGVSTEGSNGSDKKEKSKSSKCCSMM